MPFACMSIGLQQGKGQGGEKKGGEETGKGPSLPPDIAERVREGMKGVQVKVTGVQRDSVSLTDTKPDGTVKIIEHQVSTTPKSSSDSDAETPTIATLQSSTNTKKQQVYEEIMAVLQTEDDDIATQETVSRMVTGMIARRRQRIIVAIYLRGEHPKQYGIDDMVFRSIAHRAARTLHAEWSKQQLDCNALAQRARQLLAELIRESIKM